jgi:hypothetical protein
MKAIQVSKTNETKVDFEKNKLRLIRDIKSVNGIDRVMVLDITDESFYVVCLSNQGISWAKAVINFHYVSSVEIIDIEWN